MVIKMSFEIFNGRYTGAIFDLDGTLINSMWVWEGILTDFLEETKVSADPNLVNEISYMNVTQSSKYICDLFPELNMTPKEVRQHWIDTALVAYKNNIKLKEGAYDFLKRLKENGLKIAIATSCPKELATACMKSNGIYNMIDCFAFAEDLGTNKGDPQFFYKVLEEIASSPDTAILFEDIKTALVTAKGIGLKTVIIEDESSAPDKDFLIKNAYAYIRDYTELLK